MGHCIDFYYSILRIPFGVIFDKLPRFIHASWLHIPALFFVSQRSSKKLYLNLLIKCSLSSGTQEDLLTLYFIILGMFHILIWSTSFRLIIKCPYSIIINPHLNINWFTDLYNFYGILDQKIKNNFREYVNCEWWIGFILNTNSDG